MSPRSQRSTPRTMRAVALGLLLGGVIATACSNSANAFPLVNGPVSITPTTSISAGENLQSGQTIDITVAANSTLDKASLSAAGFPGGVAVMRAVECDDPDGLVSKLPDAEAYHCDGNTLVATSYVNTDGSFKIDSYVVYSLPDKPTFDESPDSLPVCGTQANQCVLYIGPNPQDFTKPHLFSAPFLVTPTTNDQGLGAVGTSAPTLGTTTASSDSRSGTLAFTGSSVTLPILVGSGVGLTVCGTEMRRRLRRRMS